MAYAGGVPWYAWVVLVVVVLFALAAIGLRILRATRRGRRFLSLSTRAKLRFARLLLADVRLGWPAKAVLVVLVTYLALPFDLIPDFIPVLGQLDDAVIFVAAILVLLRAVPPRVFDEAMVQAEREDERRRVAAAGDLNG